MNHNAVPSWKLERYLLGELPADQLAAIRAQAQTDSLLRERIEALQRDNGELLEKYPPAWMARQLKPARAGKPMVGVSRWFAPALLAAAALVMVPMVMVSQNGNPENPTIVVAENGTRIKGMEPRIEVWRKTTDSAEKMLSDSRARAGDVIQLRYAVPEPCYGALLSVDGRGVVTIHLAGDASTAAPLIPGKLIALDRSYQLDDAPRYETFYLVTAPQDFDLAPLAQALLESNQNHRPPTLRKGLHATTFTLHKGE